MAKIPFIMQKDYILVSPNIVLYLLGELFYLVRLDEVQ